MAHQHISTPTLDIAYETGGPAYGSPVLLVAMSIAWTPGPFATPALEQARRYWYQWFMATERGAAVVREQGVAFARFQWDTWSPPGWRRPFPRTRSAVCCGGAGARLSAIIGRIHLCRRRNLGVVEIREACRCDPFTSGFPSASPR